MRVTTLAALAITLAAGGAAARSVAQPDEPAPVVDEFWAEVIEPRGGEVARLVAKAREAMRIVDDQATGDAEWAVEQRMRYFRDAYALARRARELSPTNVAALTVLGRAADELGLTTVAVDALETCARLLGPDKVTAEVAARLGGIYLRRGDLERAIRTLRVVQGSGLPRGETAPALVYLATALALRGEIPAAIDTLANALPAAAQTYYSPELTLVSFALATLYDRDEQQAAALTVLERMRSALSTQFAPQVQQALALLRFAPAEDQHYYLGLLYETQNQYVEARAEFATYAATLEVAWRSRALEHVRAIDREQRTAKPVVAPPKRPPRPRGHP